MTGRKIVDVAIGSGAFAEVERALGGDRSRLWVGGLLGSSKSLLAAVLRRRMPRTWVVVAPTATDAEHVHDDLVTYLGAEDVQLFGEWETLPYERRSPLPRIVESRLVTMSRLLAGETPVVVTTPKGVMQKTLSPALLERATTRIRRGSTLRLEEAVRRLVDVGYRRVRMVGDSGEFSVRGGIVDLLPFGYDDPIRIELSGDTVESMRQFDVYTQRSVRDLDEANVLPRREVVLVDEGTAELAARLEAAYPEGSSDRERLLDGLDSGFYFDGVEQYLPVIHEDAGSLVDYLPDDAGVLLVRDDEVWDRADQISLEAAKAYMEKREDAPICEPESQLMPFDRVVSRLGPRPIVSAGLVSTDRIEGLERIEIRTTLQESVGPEFDEFRIRLSGLARSSRVFIMCDNLGQVARLRELLADAASDVALEVGSLEKGFALPEAGLVVYTDHDIFDRYRQRRRPKFRGGAPISSFEALEEGDYVVHIGHGIGCYVGVERVDADGRLVDCVVVEYADGGKLYVPSDEIDRLQKYVGKEGQTPRLNKLGGAAWGKTTTRARRAVAELARELLALYAARKGKAGHAFGEDTLWQQELEASFIYEETDDQLRAADEIKKDMEQARPMDRLVCGDVGFGKTEVAIRAAFKAAMGGKQVGVLVPTTILAQQHHTTFRDRLAEYPVEVDVISRFRTPKEQKEILERLRDGKLDVVIGTHRLIQKDVEFNDLGLLIIDEEQQFGVLHKETIQKMRRTVDVLTMTATPIPRTLHMSLMGARDMSLINTPPRDRLPVRTEIVSFDEDLIVEAVMREVDRNGQVYFVHNRVQTIDAMAALVRSVLPGVAIEVAHGQMPERQLENVMLRFLDRKIDVLVCSMIIESGLDIPNANTIIVNRADRFGLAQLYQLRGRVGRSNHRAYAYMMIPKDRTITPIARKRLAAIQEFSELSSGYKLAMRDLEIRGAGNILGAEQHGHMMAIGFNLYARLLREAVRELKGEAPREEVEARIEIKLDAYIPNSYMADNDLKIDTYKRIRDARTPEAIEELRDELDDRYGAQPPEVAALLDVQAVRVLCEKTGVRRVGIDDGLLELEFSPGREPGPGLMKQVLERCDVPLSFDARHGLVVRCEAPRERAAAVRLGRKVLKHFIGRDSVT